MNYTFRCLAHAAVLAALASSAPAALAEMLQLEAYLNGSQEVPPVPTPATGYAQIDLDTTTMTMSWDITYSDLLGELIDAHFHGPAPPGVNAPIRIPIPISPSPLVGSADVTQDDMQEILEGLWYVNLHSDLFPNGEIRGQITVVPEAGTITMTAIGGALFGFATWRRRRAKA